MIEASAIAGKTWEEWLDAIAVAALVEGKVDASLWLTSEPNELIDMVIRFTGVLPAKCVLRRGVSETCVAKEDDSDEQCLFVGLASSKPESESEESEESEESRDNIKAD